MKRVLFLIRSLDVGGAERQLVQLAIALRARGVDAEVLVFYGNGRLQPELEHAHVPVLNAAKRGRWDLLPFFWRILRCVRHRQPDVIYSFMSGANILGVLCRPASRGARLLWGVRASDVDMTQYDWFSQWAVRLERFLVRFAHLIVTNSYAGRDHCIAMGFPADRIEVVLNGIDTDRFQFDPVGRARVRREWGVEEGGVVIGMAARVHPMKGYEDFLDAAAIVRREFPTVKIVCVGEGEGTYAATLAGRAKRLGIMENVVWAGLRTDMPAVLSAFDILCSASVNGEGFSNSIAEAMSCERLCVVTNVGDSEVIVGDCGIVVDRGCADAIAGALIDALKRPALDREALGKVARARIEETASLSHLADGTMRLIDAQLC